MHENFRIKRVCSLNISIPSFARKHNSGELNKIIASCISNRMRRGLLFFYLVDRSVLWHCLSRNGVPEMYALVLKELYRLMSFVVSNGVRNACAISPFLFDFAMEYVLQNAFSGLLDDHVEPPREQFLT